MNQVQIGKYSRFLPSTWNELSYSQLISASDCFSRGMLIQEFKMELLMKFLDIPKKVFFSMDPSEAYYLGETLNFLLSEVTLTKNPISKARSRRHPFKRTLFGPGDEIKFCSFLEFMKASNVIERYAATEKIADLDELFAIMYRPKKHFWFLRKYFTREEDPRKRFSERTLEKRLRYVAHIPYQVKFSFYLVITGVLNSLPKSFPNVYRKKDSVKASSLGWAAVVISLADGKTDNESLDKIYDSNLYNVFMGLEQKSIEYFEFMKNLPKND